MKTIIILSLLTLAGCASNPRMPVSYPAIAWQLAIPPAHEVCPYPTKQCIVDDEITCCPASATR